MTLVVWSLGHAALPAGAEQSGPTPRVLVFGDSLAQGFAYGVRQAAQQRGDVLADARVADRVQIGIGLIPRGGLDPVRSVEQQLAQATPPFDAVIASLGVNDVGMPLGSGAFYGPAWQDAYRARLQTFADAVAAHDAVLAWIEVPAVRPGRFAGPLDATIRGLQNGVIRAHPGAILVETQALTARDGVFQTHMILADGNRRRLRAGDGIHFTANGYVEVARRTLDALAGRLPALPVAAEPFAVAAGPRDNDEAEPVPDNPTPVTTNADPVEPGAAAQTAALPTAPRPQRRPVPPPLPAAETAPATETAADAPAAPAPAPGSTPAGLADAADARPPSDRPAGPDADAAAIPCLTGSPGGSGPCVHDIDPFLAPHLGAMQGAGPATLGARALPN